jgi:hypothetical protein
METLELLARNRRLLQRVRSHPGAVWVYGPMPHTAIGPEQRRPALADGRWLAVHTRTANFDDPGTVVVSAIALPGLTGRQVRAAEAADELAPLMLDPDRTPEGCETGHAWDAVPARERTLPRRAECH